LSTSTLSGSLSSSSRARHRAKKKKVSNVRNFSAGRNDNAHWLENSNFSAEFLVKKLVSSIFCRKLGGKPKTFSPLLWFELKNSKES
jgi:hypothetical protein